LDAIELEIHGFGQLLDEKRFGEARDAAQEAMATREEGNEDLPDHALLTDDCLRQLALEASGDLCYTLEGNGTCGRIRQAQGSIGHAGRQCTTFVR
jgi:hypothetical protein